MLRWGDLQRTRLRSGNREPRLGVVTWSRQMGTQVWRGGIEAGASATSLASRSPSGRPLWWIDLSSPIVACCYGLEPNSWPGLAPAHLSILISLQPVDLSSYLGLASGLCTCPAAFWSVPYLLGAPGCGSSLFWASISPSVKRGSMESLSPNEGP